MSEWCECLYEFVKDYESVIMSLWMTMWVPLQFCEWLWECLFESVNDYASLWESVKGYVSAVMSCKRVFVCVCELLVESQCEPLLLLFMPVRGSDSI